jgi:hypothetical protein
MTFGLRDVGENALRFRMTPLVKSPFEHGKESSSSKDLL